MEKYKAREMFRESVRDTGKRPYQFNEDHLLEINSFSSKKSKLKIYNHIVKTTKDIVKGKLLSFIKHKEKGESLHSYVILFYGLDEEQNIAFDNNLLKSDSYVVYMSYIDAENPHESFIQTLNYYIHRHYFERCLERMDSPEFKKMLRKTGALLNTLNKTLNKYYDEGINCDGELIYLTNDEYIALTHGPNFEKILKTIIPRSMWPRTLKRNISALFEKNKAVMLLDEHQFKELVKPKILTPAEVKEIKDRSKSGVIQ